jgi:hypothetical protein
MVLTVSFVLSPVIGLVCHRHPRNLLRELDAGVEASGPHDFAVREPALSSLAPPTSTASRPASVTIASRPSVGRDGEGYRFDLGKMRSGIFLRKGLDRRAPDLPVGQRQPTRSNHMVATGCVRRDDGYADFSNNSRPISMRRISLVPAPIS